MAFLGGLMRGPAGAFVRGSLDTATNIIQASAERDEKGIEERIKGFGVKKKAYDDGINAFNSENKKIKDIAGVLASDPDFEGYSPTEIEGIAQRLITIDSNNPVKYYFDNKEKLNITKLTPKESVSTQTDSALLAGKQTPDTLKTLPKSQESDSFLGRLFGGASAQEIAERTASRLGMPMEEYNRILAGKLPTRSESTMGISVQGPDALKGVIKDTHASVRAIIASPDSPIYSTENGKKLAGTYMTAHRDYMVGADTAPTAEALSDMQSLIMSAHLPTMASKFLNIHKPFVTAAATAINGSTITADQRTKAMPLYRDIMRMQTQATGPQGNTFMADTANQSKYEDTVFKLNEVLNLTNKDSTFKNRSERIAALVKTTTDFARTHSNRFTQEQLENAFNLNTMLDIAIEQKSPDLLDQIMDMMGPDLIPKIPEEEKNLNTYQSKRDDLVRYYMSSAGGEKSKEDAANAATEHLNSGGLVTIDGLPFRPSGEGSLEEVPLTKPADRSGSGNTLTTTVRPKIYKLNVTKISNNNSSIQEIGGVMTDLINNPMAFNLYGDFALGMQDASDLSKFLFGAEITDPEAAAIIQRMRQTVTPLISTAKDRLFEDPRLSDQDLKIVLGYVAVIQDKTIGDTRAIAALHGIQRALAIDNALRMYEQQPNAVIAEYNQRGSIKAFDASGKFNKDASIATKIISNVATANGVSVLTKEERSKLTSDERALYDKKFSTVLKIANEAVTRVNTLRDLNGDVGTMRSNYATRSSFQAIPNVTGANFQSEIDAGIERFKAKTEVEGT